MGTNEILNERLKSLKNGRSTASRSGPFRTKQDYEIVEKSAALGYCFVMKLSALQVLFWIDGIGHLVLGPLAFIFSQDLSEIVGIPADRLEQFFVLFTLYGFWAVFAPKKFSDKTAIIGGLIANGLFIVLIMLSAAVHSLSLLSLFLHVAVIVSAITVMSVLGFGNKLNS